MELKNILKTHICCSFGSSEATTAIGQSTGTDTESMGSNCGIATLFSPDSMFSGPLFGCSRSPEQAWKPGVRLGSLQSGLEASQAALRPLKQPLRPLKRPERPLWPPERPLWPPIEASLASRKASLASREACLASREVSLAAKDISLASKEATPRRPLGGEAGRRPPEAEK